VFFIVEDLLTKIQVERVSKLTRGARFIDGRATANLPKMHKNNLEMEIGEAYVEVAGILNEALERSRRIRARILPRTWTHPIINRYDTGMHYAEHTDVPIQGATTQAGRMPGRFGQNLMRTDYSMTLFLTDVDQYDGGELELRIFDETRRIKLPAGSAVCYSTGLPHSVRAVTRGSRIAGIYWFQSMIRDVQVRRALSELSDLEEQLAGGAQRELADKAAAIHSNMIRYLAEI
jgi:PKHD-type hydroxylase